MRTRLLSWMLGGVVQQRDERRVSLPATLLQTTDTPYQQYLIDDFPEDFRQRQLEMDTPNRTYCSSIPCSIFIGPSNIEGDKATCPNCDTRTCTICKGGAHDGDCPQDPAVVALTATAVREGFKQCPSCRLLVELTFGCNHVTYAIFGKLKGHSPD